MRPEISFTYERKGVRHQLQDAKSAADQNNQKCCYSHICGELSFRSLLLTIVVIILTVVTVASWFIGASVAGTGKDKLQTDKTCSKMEHDPPNPIANENIYAWYLVNTGIFLFIFSFISCIWCTSFIGLCCGDFPPIITTLSIAGCFITGAGVIIFIGWTSVGTYLLSTISPDNFHEPLCKSIVIYLVVLYISLSTFLVACVVGCLWRSMKECSINVFTPNTKMLNRYKETHAALKRDLDEGGDGRASLVSKHLSTLLMILNKQLLRHEFLQASHTMEAITTAMDQVPVVVRKAGIEVLLHDRNAYGECLQLYKELFTKQTKQRVDLLLEMTIYIATHSNIQEAYDTLQSQVSTEPFKSSPLIVGYCGMLQYMLWKRELHASVKHEEEVPDYEHLSVIGESDYGQPDVKPSIRTQAYLNKALTHFESLRQLKVLERDNLLLSIGSDEKGLRLLMEQEQKQPHWISIKRCICRHLREFCTDNIPVRLKYLKDLVEVDDSCSEGIEYVELLLNQDPCDYPEAFKVLVKHLDYPSNAENQPAWDYLHQIQNNWERYVENKLWKNRLDWWRDVYPNRTSYLSVSTN